MIPGRLLYVATAGTVAVSLAWKASAQMHSGTREPDASHGAVIAAQGTPNAAPACAQCHAFNGVSDGSGAFPRIAGQSAYYLAKQLRDFTSGVRVIMTPIAQALTADDIADVAATMPGSKRPSCRCRDPTRRSSSRARSWRKLAAQQAEFRPAIIAMELAAQASHRRFLILPDNTRPTSPSNGECGSAASVRAAPVRWHAWRSTSTIKKSRQLLTITSRSLSRPRHRSRRFHVD
jgi:cytochrome c553